MTESLTEDHTEDKSCLITSTWDSVSPYWAASQYTGSLGSSKPEILGVQDQLSRFINTVLCKI